MKPRNAWLSIACAALVIACAEPGAGNPPPSRPEAGSGGAGGVGGSASVGATGGTAGVGGQGGTGGVSIAGEGGSAGISGTGGSAGSAGTGGSAGAAGVGGEGGGGGTGGEPMCDLPATNPEFFCDPTGDGPCQNCHDCQQIESGAAKTAAKDCGVSCGTDRNCTTSCVNDRIGATPACTECLADFYDCLISTCLVECLGAADVCTTCSRTKKDVNGLSCSDKWFACSGTELNPNF